MSDSRLFGSKMVCPAPALVLLAGAAVGLLILVSLVSIAPQVELFHSSGEYPQAPLLKSCPNGTQATAEEKPALRQESHCLECDLLLLNNIKKYEDVGLTPCNMSYYELADFGRWLASKKAHGQNLAVSLGDSLLRIQTNTIFKSAPINNGQSLNRIDTSRLGNKTYSADILCCNNEEGVANASCGLYFVKDLPEGLSAYAHANGLLQEGVYDWCWIFEWAATVAHVLTALPTYFSNAGSITPAAVVVNPVLHHMLRNNTRGRWVDALNSLADTVEGILEKQALEIKHGNFDEKTRFLYHTGTAVYESEMAFLVPLYRKEREVVLNRDLERVLRYERPGLFTLVDANRLTQGYWYNGLINPPKGNGAHPFGDEFYVLINIVDWNILIRNLSRICIREDSGELMELGDFPRGKVLEKLAADLAYPMPRVD